MLALNHEPLEKTVHQVLPYAIKLLQSKGYELVTLAECLNLPAYQWETAPGVPDVSPGFLFARFSCFLSCFPRWILTDPVCFYVAYDWMLTVVVALLDKTLVPYFYNSFDLEQSELLANIVLACFYLLPRTRLPTPSVSLPDFTHHSSCSFASIATSS